MSHPKGTVLVVDDSATVRKQVRTVLEEAGYSVVEAEDGAEGLRQTEAHCPALLIVDVHMPVMDGYSMVAELRRLPAYARTPVFMLTTESSQKSARLGRDAGATAWIVKPFNAVTLREGVEKALRR